MSIALYNHQTGNTSAEMEMGQKLEHFLSIASAPPDAELVNTFGLITFPPFVYFPVVFPWALGTQSLPERTKHSVIAQLSIDLEDDL